MDVGILLVYAHWHENLSDAEVFRQETELAVLAEDYGYDSVWLPEHHFDNYAMSPDNLQTLSYIAGRTNRIKLGTGAVILPWNDPLRVVEKVLVLDHLSGGRVLFGMGRGLAKMEYEGFGVDMDTSRDRFDEASEMIVRGLRNGYVENDGTYYKQPRVDIRPGVDPHRPWDGRIYGVAMSPDSIAPVARLGTQMMSFIQKPVEQHAPAFDEWRRLYREATDAAPPPVLTLDTTYCHEDAEEAERTAREYIGRHFLSVVKHYDFAGSHWRKTKGYESYQDGADMIRAAGLEAAAQGFADSQLWGTPDQILEKFQARFDVLGDTEVVIQPSFGGLPFEKVRPSMQLFAEKVIPELKRLGAKTTTAA